MYKKLILFFIILSSFPLFSQNNTVNVDKETYNLYLEEKWPDLIKTGKHALKNNIDFYYLRYRLGLAYYNDGKYRNSIIHLEKTLKYNSNDDFLKQVLYKAYLLSNRDADAVFLSKSFSDSLKKSMNLKSKLINNIEINSSLSFINNKNIADKNNINTELDPTIQGYQVISKSYNTFQLTSEHYFFKRFKLSHSFTKLSKSNYTYLKNFTGIYENQNSLVHQNQYYLNLSFLAFKGTKIFGGFHYINLKYKIDSLAFNPPGFKMNRVDVIENGISIFGGIEKDFRNFKLSADYSFTDYFGETQQQENFTLEWYPLSNLNLYTVSILSSIQNKNLNNKLSKIILFQKVGFSIKRKIWIEMFTLIGEIDKFNLNQSAIIYTNTNTIRNLYGGNIIIPVKNLFLTLTYNYTNYNSYFFEFQEGELNKPVSFNHHLLKGGIKWEF